MSFVPKGAVRAVAAALALLLIFPAPARAAETESFTAPVFDMPTDAGGDNLRGNLPEQTALGGYYAVQGDWLFYADAQRGGALSASNADGSRQYPLTEFPVANLNVMGDTLVFTDISSTIAQSYAFDTRYESPRLSPGGKLYRMQGVWGLTSGRVPEKVEQIGGNRAFYRVSMNEGGIFALCGAADSSGTDWTYVRVEDGSVTPILAAGGGEVLVNMVDKGDVLYFETDNSDGWGNIVRYSPAENRIIDAVPGRELSCYGERIFFISNTNQYLYELLDGQDYPTPVSCCTVRTYALLDNGDIDALAGNGQTKLLISLYGGYKGYIGPYKVGEWYNYFLANQPVQSSSTSHSSEDSSSSTGGGTDDDSTSSSSSSSSKSSSSSSKSSSSSSSGGGGQKPPKVNQKNSMPPEAAVEMVMTMVRGGTTDDAIFNRYYDEAAKTAFRNYMTESFGAYEWETMVSEALRSFEGIFSKENEQRFLQLFKDYLSKIEYTLITAEQTNTTAVVHMHVTQTVNLNFDDLNMSQSDLQAYLLYYMDKNGMNYSDLQSLGEAELIDLLVNVCLDYLEEILVPVEVSKDLIFKLEADPVLKWKITTPGTLDDLDSGSGGDDFIGCNLFFEPPEEPTVELPPDDEENTGGENQGGGDKGGNANGTGGGRNEPLQCGYQRVIYERETKNIWQVLGGAIKEGWNALWGIETPKYTPKDTYLKTEDAYGPQLPGATVCLKSIDFVVLKKPPTFWEMVKGWFTK